MTGWETLWEIDLGPEIKLARVTSLCCLGTNLNGAAY